MNQRIERRSPKWYDDPRSHSLVWLLLYLGNSLMLGTADPDDVHLCHYDRIKYGFAGRTRMCWGFFLPISHFSAGQNCACRLNMRWEARFGSRWRGGQLSYAQYFCLGEMIYNMSSDSHPSMFTGCAGEGIVPFTSNVNEHLIPPPHSCPIYIHIIVPLPSGNQTWQWKMHHL